MKPWMYRVLIVVFSGIFLFAVWELISLSIEYKKGADTYQNISSAVIIPPVIVDDTTDEPVDRTAWPIVDFDALAEINPDVVGWIYIENTNINYPIAQGEDDEYYLTHLFDGTKNSSGCIFLDADVPSDFSAKNSSLHGHHMKNDTMFADLVEYKAQEFYDLHPTALLMTPEKNYKVHLFAGYTVKADADVWNYGFTDEELTRWINNATSKSFFDATVTPTLDDRFLTLSTCTYEYNNARFVVHGIMEEQVR